MQNTNDIGAAFDALIKTNFVTYKGIILERQGKGFIWKGTYYPTLAEVNTAIEAACKYIQKSISKN